MESERDSRRESSESQIILRGIESVSGIAAQMMEAQLVEQGIVGKPLAVRKLTKSYKVYCIKPWRIMGKKQIEYRLTYKEILDVSEPLITCWAPPTIPKSIWDFACPKFSLCGTLADNIERYLLPQFDSILDLFSYKQIYEATIQTFLENGILMEPIRTIKQTIYYFDAAQIYQKDTKVHWQANSKDLYLWYYANINMRIFRKASINFLVGSTLKDCVEIFLKTNLCTTPKKRPPLDFLVTGIGAVSYERIPENENPKTFDYIRVQVNLSHTAYATWEELKQGVRQHRKEIDELVVKKIQNDRGFRKFGVPLSAVNLSERILSSHYFLEYIFDLKDSMGIAYYD